MPACICFEEGGGRGLPKVHTPPSPRERERELECTCSANDTQQWVPHFVGQKNQRKWQRFGKCTYVQREEGEKQGRVERKRVFGTMLLDSVPEAGCWWCNSKAEREGAYLKAEMVKRSSTKDDSLWRRRRRGPVCQSSSADQQQQLPLLGRVKKAQFPVFLEAVPLQTEPTIPTTFSF